ncbi:MAG: 2-C-methyl-D-erythritol 2,4-cyclodiphosphate synthase [Gammaproteobacteria bacterium]|nr:MAG: 2-C-methyl-D-erythritol 2,4-cyclodiphosphate synthase [Gammaproteobacteria bacterium]
MKIGHGYDVHAFTAGDHVMIGGVKIPYDKAFAAHSDGDVLIHAICDALLGALALGDIGKHFPDTDTAFTDIDSRILLRRVFASMQQRGYHIGNIDATVIAQAPKMRPHIDTMRANLAADLNTAVESINIKATTTEKLGFAGRQEGIAAHAVCILLKSADKSC